MVDINLNQNYVLRSDVEVVVNEFFEDFKHVYLNFKRILFIKLETEPKAVEIYKLNPVMKQLLPDYDYIIICSEKYNYLGTKKTKELYHVLKHIPTLFNGELIEHDIEKFSDEKRFDED